MKSWKDVRPGVVTDPQRVSAHREKLDAEVRAYRLAEIRREQDLTQAEVAEIIGITQPNVYNFNSTSYANMHDELLSKDQRLYRANGILPMLERNKGVKWGPERWQDWRVGVPRVGPRGDGDWSQDKGSQGTEGGTVDIVITCEERCWDAVVDDLMTRGAPLNRPVHVFNVDIKDNHEEALVGGRAILELADALNKIAAEERDEWLRKGDGSGGFDNGAPGARQGFDERVPDVLASWQERWPHLPALWTLAWF